MFIHVGLIPEEVVRYSPSSNMINNKRNFNYTQNLKLIIYVGVIPEEVLRRSPSSNLKNNRRKFKYTWNLKSFGFFFQMFG